MKKAKRIFNIIGTILLILLLAIVVLMFNARVSGDSPEVFGYHVFRVSSGSMEPTLMIGDVILVKEAEPQDIHKGDIITYKGDEGDLNDKYITHQVSEEPFCNESGEYEFTTKGIVVGAITDPIVDEDQVIGVYQCKINFFDKLYTFFLTPYGLMAFIIVIFLLFGYELVALVVAYKTIDEPDDIDENDSDDQSHEDSKE